MWKLDTLVPPGEEDLACVTNTVTLIYTTVYSLKNGGFQRMSGSTIYSDYSAFSAFFSEKSAFSGGGGAAVNHKHLQFNELIDGIPFAQSLVEAPSRCESSKGFQIKNEALFA